MRTRLISLSVVLVVAMAACGSDDGDTSDTTSPASTTTALPSTTATTALAGGDMDTVKKLVVVSSDLPAGWTGAPDDQTEDASDKAVSDELNACVGTSGDEAETASWTGDDFSMGDAQISSEANMVKDEATFRRDVEAIESPRLQSCVRDVYSKALAAEIGVAPTSFDVGSLDVGEYGDTTVGVRMTVGVTARGESQTFYVDLVLMGKGRAEVSTSFVGVGQPFDPALQESVIQKLGERVEAL